MNVNNNSPSERSIFSILKDTFLNELKSAGKTSKTEQLEGITPKGLNKTKKKILQLINKYDTEPKKPPSAETLEEFKTELNTIKTKIEPSKYNPLRVLNRHPFSLSQIEAISKQVEGELETSTERVEANSQEGELETSPERVGETLTERVDDNFQEGELETLPHNYNKIKIPGLGIRISGMAHPIIWTKNSTPLRTIVETLKKTCKIDVMVSLDDRNTEEIKTEWGENYHFFEVIDWQSPTTEQMKELAKIADKANVKGQNIIIHCGEGIGRTGTMMASLILRMLVKNQLKVNPEYFSQDQTALKAPLNMDLTTYSLKATPLVKEAIKQVRFTYAASSVEMTDQVKELEKYEEILRKELNPNNIPGNP